MSRPVAFISATLGDVVEFTNGGAWRESEYAESGIPVIRVSDFRDNTVDLAECKYLPSSSLQTYAKHLLSAGDLVIATVGSHPTQPASVVGRPVIIPRAAHGALLNQNAVRLRPRSAALDREFLGYLGRSPQFRAYIIAHARGAANQVRMSIELLKQMPVTLPPINLQQRVAAILSAYDQLIYNNARRMAILEDAARALYREWFVDFRFIGRDNTDMRDSALGPIPADWQVQRLGDALSVLESGSRPRGGIDPAERGVVSVGAENVIGLGRYSFDLERYVSAAFFQSMRRGVVRNGDVLLYKDGAHIGRLSMFRDGFPHARLSVNEHVFLLRAKPPLTQSYLYFVLDQPGTREAIRNLNSNAAQPGLNQAAVRSLELLVPKASIVARWEAFVEPLLGLLFNLAKRNRILVQTLDLLLPKLISREVDTFALDVLAEELVPALV